VGFTATFAHLIQNYPVGGQSEGQGTYKPFSVMVAVSQKKSFSNSKSS
jgi:hypothetical protein